MSSSMSNIYIISLLDFKKFFFQRQVPLPLPCYDFTPVKDFTVTASLPFGLRTTASDTFDSQGVTGGVCKIQELFHRYMLISDY